MTNQRNLQELLIICESIRMRRDTIKINCKVMQEKIEEEYKQALILKKSWDLGNKKVLEEVEVIKQSYEDAKYFYDMSVMLERTKELSESVTKMGKTESKLYKLSGEVNQKVSDISKAKI